MTEATKSISAIDVDKSIKDDIKNAVKYLEKECGCQISEEKFEEFDDSVEISISVFFSMKDIPNLLQDPTNPKRDKSIFWELVKYFVGGGTRSLQALGFSVIQRTRLTVPEARAPYYRAAADRLRARLQQALGTDGVLLYPVFIGAAHAHHQVFPRACGVAYTMPCNVLGAPAACVPLPPRALPRALQVIAAPHQDRLCLAVARHLEVAFGGWKPPE